MFKTAALTSLRAAGALASVTGLQSKIEVNPLRFWHPNVPRSFHGYKIAQFSDVHLNGSKRSMDLLVETVDLILAEKPDLIVFTGDFITANRRVPEDAIVPQLRRLTAPDGVLAIFGNHELLYTRLTMQKAIAEAGITDLNNKVVSIRRGDDVLHIAGVDSVVRQRSRLDKVMAALPDDGMAILLAHEPDFADFASSVERFTLQLSGHTHGGQIYIPALLGLVLPAHGRHYIRGIHPVRSMWLYINRGIGTMSVPLRLFSRPEVTLLTLGILNLPKPPPNP